MAKTQKTDNPGRFIHQVAKDLGLSSKSFAAPLMAKEFGWDTSSHMKRLSPEQEAEVTKRIKGELKEGKESRSQESCCEESCAQERGGS